MLSLAKQHLQQHAQLQEQLQRSAAQHQSHGQRVPSHKAALADFPLAAPAPGKGAKGGKAQAKAKAAALQKPAFAAKASRRASSKAVLKRAKLLARKMPRPSLLERAERALADATPDATAIAARNQRILSHESDRKQKTQAAMKKILLATTLPSRHAAKDDEEEEEDDERDDFDDAELDEFMD